MLADDLLLLFVENEFVFPFGIEILVEDFVGEGFDVEIAICVGVGV